MFGYRLRFSGSVDRMALFNNNNNNTLIYIAPACRMTSEALIISKMSADRHLGMMALSRVTLASAGLSCYYMLP